MSKQRRDGWVCILTYIKASGLFFAGFLFSSNLVKYLHELGRKLIRLVILYMFFGCRRPLSPNCANRIYLLLFRYARLSFRRFCVSQALQHLAYSCLRSNIETMHYVEPHMTWGDFRWKYCSALSSCRSYWVSLQIATPGMLWQLISIDKIGSHVVQPYHARHSFEVGTLCSNLLSLAESPLYLSPSIHPSTSSSWLCYYMHKFPDLCTHCF